MSLSGDIYGCETWTLNEQTTQRLIDTQRTTDRYILGKNERDRKTNEWIFAQTKLIETARKVKWRWICHIAIRTDGR